MLHRSRRSTVNLVHRKRRSGRSRKSRRRKRAVEEESYFVT